MYLPSYHQVQASRAIKFRIVRPIERPVGATLPKSRFHVVRRAGTPVGQTPGGHGSTLVRGPTVQLILNFRVAKMSRACFRGLLGARKCRIFVTGEGSKNDSEGTFGCFVCMNLDVFLQPYTSKGIAWPRDHILRPTKTNIWPTPLK